MAYRFLITNLQAVVLNLCQVKSLKTNFINHLLEKFKRCKVYSSFKDNIWGADLAGMQLKSKLIFCD